MKLQTDFLFRGFNRSHDGFPSSVNFDFYKGPYAAFRIIEDVEFETSTLDPPTFDLATGTYTSAFSLSFVHPKMNVVSIFYTTDGSSPLTSGTRKQWDKLPINFINNGTFNFRAIAESHMYLESTELTGSFTLEQTVSQPSISNVGDVYNPSIEILDATSGAQIRYTLDGSVPTISSTLYSTPFPITEKKTIRAIAFKTGWINSTEASLVVTPKALVPLASGSDTDNDFNVTLTVQNAGATIKYTTDGTDPKISGTAAVYSTPIPVNRTMLIRAYCVGGSLYVDSDSTSFNYTLTVADPNIVVDSSDELNPFVTMSSLTTGCQIRYTLDGSAPNGSSTLYSGVFYPTETATIRAVAIKSGYNSSTIIDSAVVIKCKVVTPSIASGSQFSTAQSLILNCATVGASIKYTLDGSDPAVSGTAITYGGAISLDGNVTVKAVGTKAGMTTSDLMTASYSFVTADPQTDNNGGAFQDGPQIVHLTTATVDATIKYTLDGTNPAVSGTALVYSGSISINTSATLRFYAYKANYTNSNVIDAASSFSFSAALPTIDINGGNFSSGSQSVTLSCTTTGASIKYTLDGSDPSVSGIPYAGPITVDHSCSVKFYAYKIGYTPSSVVTSNAFVFQVATPTIDVNGGAFTDGPQSITLACSTVTSSIKYTTDGTDPSVSGTALVYSTPIALDKSCVLRFYAYKSGYTPSTVQTSNAFTFTVIDPTIDVNGGAFGDGPQTIHLNSLTSGVSFDYTLDGNSPLTNGIPYSGSILLDQSCTLKFIAKKVGYTTSAIKSSAPFVFTCGNPSIGFNKNNVMDGSNTLVTITNPNAGMQTKYTTDGSDPVTNGIVYSGPFNVNGTKTVKAVNVRAGYTNSQTISNTVTYGIQTPTIDFNGGTYENAKTVTLSCLTPGISFKYTLDGSDPSVSGTAIAYPGPVSIDANCTLKFYAYRTDYTNSLVVTTSAFVFNVATPTLDVNGGAFSDGPQTVHISSLTTGAAIKYTTDGTDPKVSGSVYSGSISVDKNCVVKFYAYKAGYNDSSVQTSPNFVFTVAQPQLDINGGSYSDGPQTVHLSCGTSGATIKYTTDGSDPKISGTALIYGTSISVNKNCNIRAYAYKTNYTDSSTFVSSAFAFTVLNPTISDINGGTFSNGPQNVHLACGTSGVSYKYTLDGSDPKSSGTAVVYAGSIPMDQSGTIRFYAYKTGYTDSAVINSTAFTFNVATPTIDVNGGPFSTGPQTIVLSCATSGAAIKYTTDGTDPSVSGTALVFSGSISLDKSCSIKFYAYKTGYTSSSIQTSNAFVFSVNNPTADSVGGTFSDGNPQYVNLTCTTAGASIKYTLDGTDPSSSGTAQIYASTLSIEQNCTLRFYAYKTGYTPSSLRSISPFVFAVSDPTTDLNSGSFDDGPQLIHLSCTTAGAAIKYTTDGSDPSISGTAVVYSGNIALDKSCVLKYYAYKTGYTPSAIKTSGSFVFTCASPTISTSQNSVSDGTDTTFSISTAHPSYAIFYTLDGSDPATFGILYEGAVSFNGTKTIKAVCTKNNYSDSPMVSKTVTYSLLDPSDDRASGVFGTSFNVALTKPLPSSTIKYTLDGSNPETNGTVYSGPIPIDVNLTLRYVAIQSGYTSSSIIQRTYEFKASNPSFVLAEGTYYADQYVALQIPNGFSALYSTDGSEPSIPYAGAILIQKTTTLKARTVLSGWTSSDLVSGVYSFQCSIPTIDPDSVPEYEDLIQITLTPPTPGSTVKYTVDGSNPATGLTYSGPFLLKHSQTVKAIAIKADFANSLQASRTYTLNPARPLFSLSAESFTGALLIGILRGTNDEVEIRYTIDGSEPTLISRLYTQSFVINETTTIRARIFDSVDGRGSLISQVIYTKTEEENTVSTKTQNTIAGTTPANDAPPANRILSETKPMIVNDAVVGVFRSFSQPNQLVVESASRDTTGASKLARIDINSDLATAVITDFTDGDTL